MQGLQEIHYKIQENENLRQQMNVVNIQIVENAIATKKLKNQSAVLQKTYDSLNAKYQENYIYVQNMRGSEQPAYDRNHEIEMATRQIRNGINRLTRIARH